MTMTYRGMDRAALDEAYNNVKAVGNFPAVLTDFQARSAAIYEDSHGERDVPYGNGERERFDFIRSSNGMAPTVVYVHGGYWQTLRKEDFAFIAAGPLALGCHVVLAEYTLAPQASMTQIVQEIGRLLDHIEAHREDLSIGSAPVALVGHSAGAHLSLLHRSHRLLSHTMAVSPIVDLKPISLSWLNENLNLSAEEIDTYSPLHHIGQGTSTTIAVGSAELPELVRHSVDYAQAATLADEAARYMSIERGDHFSVLEALASADGELAKVVAAALES